MKLLEVLRLPPRWDACPTQVEISLILIYTPGWRNTVRVKCLAQEKRNDLDTSWLGVQVYLYICICNFCCIFCVKTAFLVYLAWCKLSLKWKFIKLSKSSVMNVILWRHKQLYLYLYEELILNKPLLRRWEVLALSNLGKKITSY